MNKNTALKSLVAAIASADKALVNIREKGKAARAAGVEKSELRDELRTLFGFDKTREGSKPRHAINSKISYYLGVAGYAKSNAGSKGGAYEVTKGFVSYVKKGLKEFGIEESDYRKALNAAINEIVG